MRLDVVSIFPDYLAPLDLSLIGKARRDGLLDLTVHDLRDFAHDRHRTVDDTPYGGGAGMVMKPQPWSEALDHVVAQGSSAFPGAAERVPTLIVPGPGGEPFTQQIAKDLAEEPWLAFACGRYEGIDERVYEWAGERMPVRILSLGDYVLNGGEVAVLAMVEAIARLLPGVIGNAESLIEESHEDGLLEYPVYTKPAEWDGRAVPEVLLGGNHRAIAEWRHEQRVQRTAARRPDLLPPVAAAAALADLEERVATPADAPDLQVLTRACWAPEFARYGMFGAGEEDLETVRDGIQEWDTRVWRRDGTLIASVRVRPHPTREATWQIGRLMVAPYLQGRGLGRELLAYAESLAPEDIRTFWLNTGAKSTENLRMYRKAGYRVRPGEGEFPGTVDLTKRLVSAGD
ncbi:tRNA (guanosine(37)-N1)-methyltransferase TrmD [Knoellia subterranea]|uniref:tRNA (guanine-N(1)-)-methyltransferase n=1 Tax=Knoellia subterranea KCTC 19937 TaxID=1385521 RepID=A0A0A0JH37_9MICO|nr:tRNA (guanosine(37)-N1)-methyltransferase TrmD [Knoellia subterranea]KGN36745.1 transposon TnsE [Knoellia subterranea KCTC 19937]